MTRKKHHDGAPAADAPREVAAAERAGEKAWQAALRPRTFDEYIGQRELIDNLKVSVRAAKQNGWALDHFLFAGPPGLGKTTLAHVLANELGVNLHVSSGPAIDHKGMLASLLTSLGEGARGTPLRNQATWSLKQSVSILPQPTLEISSFMMMAPMNGLKNM